MVFLQTILRVFISGFFNDSFNNAYSVLNIRTFHCHAAFLFMISRAFCCSMHTDAVPEETLYVIADAAVAGSGLGKIF